VSLARRVKEIRARALVRRWEFRQRNLAHGAWLRLRVALAMAKEAYAIDSITRRQLIDEGFPEDRRGQDLEPPRFIVWITPERVSSLTGARPQPLRLDAAMLASTELALVPFPGIDPLASSR
jgi:hypothetical protein